MIDMKYKVYCISAMMLCCVVSKAQEKDTVEVGDSVKKENVSRVWKNVKTRTIRGKVLSGTDKKPKGGAMVSTHGISGYSTLTEEDGTFKLDLPVFASSIDVSSPDDHLVEVGLRSTEEQPLIFLYPQTVAPLYGKKTDILNTRVADGFNYSPSLSVEEDVQRELGASVHTVMRNGTPGIGGVMMMSGLNSINANAQPLIVIDGVPLDQQYGREMLHDGFYNNILTNINPADIDRVTVLRNGTALYGAKGANGIILIDTRRSKSMATRITASLSAGVTLEPRYYDMMNASQYRTYASEMLKTTNTTIRDFNFLDDSPSNYYAEKYNKNTDWKEKVYREAFMQNYGINVEGGDEVAQYNLSLGYTGAQSTLEQNDMDRLNIRFNSDIALGSKLDVRFDAAFTNITRNLRDDAAPSSYEEGTPTSPSFLAYAKAPMLSPYTFSGGKIYENHLDVTDETYLDEALAGYSNYNWKLGNPLAILEYGEAQNKNHFENSMLSLSIKPKFKFNDHLSLSEHFSYVLTNTNEKYYIPLNGVPDYYVSSLGAFRQNEARSLFSKQNSIMSDTRLEWDQRYAAHAIALRGGFRMQWDSYQLNTQVGYNTGNDKTPFISSSLLDAATGGTNDQWNSLAYYVQADYNFKGRYYLQATMAAESSSRFGRDTDQGVKMCGVKWGIFPGFQASWVATNESWMAGLGFLNYLRLSAGVDVSGNDDLPYYATRSYFASSDYMGLASGLTIAGIGNEKIQWERTRRINIGVDANLLNNRLGVRFNYFRSATDHLLMWQEMSYLSGLDKTWGNGGKLENRGFDVEATGVVWASPSWQWQVGASVGHYKNKVTALPDGQRYMDTEILGATVRTEIGRPANLFYGYKAQGVFSTSAEAQAAGLYIHDDNGVDRTAFEAGDMHFADLDGDHFITEADRMVIGDPNPDIYGNIFTSVQYRRLRLDVRFNYSLGNDIYNYTRQQLELGSRFMNQTTALARRWQMEGQQTDIPRLSFQDPMGNSRFSDRWIEDGSYLRLKTVTLSYDLPVSSTFLQGLQFWVQANNVVTLTRYLGSDPEGTALSAVLGQGIDAGSLPQSRNFMVGIKINL